MYASSGVAPYRHAPSRTASRAAALEKGRRSSGRRGDDRGVSAESDPTSAPRTLLALYEEALPVVYGYFVRRCGDRGAAEDLTSETFLAAMDAARNRIRRR